MDPNECVKTLETVVVGSYEVTLMEVCDCDTTMISIDSILLLLSVLVLIVKHEFL